MKSMILKKVGFLWLAATISSFYVMADEDDLVERVNKRSGSARTAVEKVRTEPKRLEDLVKTLEDQQKENNKALASAKSKVESAQAEVDRIVAAQKQARESAQAVGKVDVGDVSDAFDDALDDAKEAWDKSKKEAAAAGKIVESTKAEIEKQGKALEIARKALQDQDGKEDQKVYEASREKLEDLLGENREDYFEAEFLSRDVKGLSERVNDKQAELAMFEALNTQMSQSVMGKMIRDQVRGIISGSKQFCNAVTACGNVGAEMSNIFKDDKSLQGVIKEVKEEEGKSGE